MGIWRSESAARGDELAHADDDDGAATWRRIMSAVTQLANKTRPTRSISSQNLTLVTVLGPLSRCL